MWPTLEYAIIRFRSTCGRHTSLAYTIETVPKIARTHHRSFAALGSIPTPIRNTPYPPIFRSRPARITDPAVGASTCASGSHVWNGTIGSLTPNPKKNAMKIGTWVARGRRVRYWAPFAAPMRNTVMSNVFSLAPYTKVFSAEDPFQ